MAAETTALMLKMASSAAAKVGMNKPRLVVWNVSVVSMKAASVTPAQKRRA